MDMRKLLIIVLVATTFFFGVVWIVREYSKPTPEKNLIEATDPSPATKATYSFSIVPYTKSEINSYGYPNSMAPVRAKPTPISPPAP
jgi:hypothetical protein